MNTLKLALALTLLVIAPTWSNPLVQASEHQEQNLSETFVGFPSQQSLAQFFSLMSRVHSDSHPVRYPEDVANALGFLRNTSLEVLQLMIISKKGVVIREFGPTRLILNRKHRTLTLVRDTGRANPILQLKDQDSAGTYAWQSARYGRFIEHRVYTLEELNTLRRQVGFEIAQNLEIPSLEEEKAQFSHQVQLTHLALREELKKNYDVYSFERGIARAAGALQTGGAVFSVASALGNPLWYLAGAVAFDLIPKGLQGQLSWDTLALSLLSPLLAVHDGLDQIFSESYGVLDLQLRQLKNRSLQVLNASLNSSETGSAKTDEIIEVSLDSQGQIEWFATYSPFRGARYFYRSERVNSRGDFIPVFLSYTTPKKFLRPGTPSGEWILWVGDT